MSQKPYDVEKWVYFQTKAQKSKKVHYFYLRDLVTCTREWEISALSGRLPDNLGELA